MDARDDECVAGEAYRYRRKDTATLVQTSGKQRVSAQSVGVVGDRSPCARASNDRREVQRGPGACYEMINVLTAE